MYDQLKQYLESRAREASLIDEARRATLEELAGSIRDRHDAGDSALLVFICTHNSRRSHLAQLWAAAAAHARDIPIETFSGGTEATAFNPRAAAAMQRAGWGIEMMAGGENPVYGARLGPDGPILECFSKRFDADPNPAAGFTAVMVCDEAAEACPVVPGADRRFSLAYVDPKHADASPEEEETYDECCARIAREMVYVIRRV